MRPVAFGMPMTLMNPNVRFLCLSSMFAFLFGGLHGDDSGTERGG